MIHLNETIEVERDQNAAFAYTADFANIAEWDPGVVKSARSSDGDIGVGSTFDVEIEFSGRRQPMTYEITEYDAPNEVVLVGEGATIKAVDTITFAATDGRTRIEYDAELTLKGWIRYAELPLRPAFDKVGKKAVGGLKARLDDKSLQL